MPYMCLLLSGAVLLVNGLATLGHLPRRDAAVLSLVVGILQLVLGVVVLSPGPSAGEPLTGAGMFLFGLTYVYVGLDFLLGLGSKGLGWFCGMVAFVGLLLAAAWLREDPLLAVLWLGWSGAVGVVFCLDGPGPGPDGLVHRLGTGAYQPGHGHDPGFPGAGRTVAAQPIGCCRCIGVTDGVVRPRRRPCPADPGRTQKSPGRCCRTRPGPSTPLHVSEGRCPLARVPQVVELLPPFNP